MRADRLVATLLVMQARGRVTAAELADELEVSVATARRDLAALSTAGVPVYPQPGRGGGWSLVGGARTDLSGLTATEARTLFLVAGPSAAVTPEAKAALRKLVQALPETFRAEAEAAASAIVLDPAGWGQTTPKPPPHLDELQRAVVEGVQVELGYADRTRAVSERTVHPLGLVAKGSVWYLVAGTEAGLRTFRVGRVRSVAPNGQPVVRPDGFDLSATWDEIVTRMDEQRATHRTTIRVEARAIAWLRGTFGTRLIVADQVGHLRPGSHGDGETRWLEAEVRGYAPGSTASELVGFGRLVEVLSPPDVRAALATLGADLVSRYAGPDPAPADA
jgi:predicted DNA-binding transcriptional regulator YafY